MRSLQTVAFLSVRRGDEASVAVAGAAHRPKPPHLNHTALKLGHLKVAWKHLSHSPRLLEALTSPSRPAFHTISPESHQKWPPRRGWISKLHVISKLHYKYHSTELKQLVRCGFSDPTIFSSCRNNARISVQLSNYPVRRSPFCTRKLVNQVP